jgi:hypothetical protein
MSLKLTASCPLPPKSNIYHWHAAEHINSDVPTFNKKCQFFHIYITEQFYFNYKVAPEKKVRNDPGDTSLKENPSIDTTFDPC